jgi:hypothetical protein
MELINEFVEGSGEPEYPLIFTRYLYPKIYVKQSLFLSLLDKKYDESLFWAYELYFSGFKDETYDYILEIYNHIYKSNYPNLQNFIENTHKDWLKNNDQDWLIGSIVGTLSKCNYCLTEFIKDYLHVICKLDHNIKTSNKKTFIIHLSNEDIDKYKTKYYSPIRHCLRIVCKYPIRVECNTIFKSDIRELRNHFYYNWLFYACQSPLWLDILHNYNGRVNIITKKIEFDDEKSEEEFYEKWNLEPDEQPLEIQNKIIGSQDCTQLHLKEFCEKYGSPLLTKKIQKNIETSLEISFGNLKI